jgi:hypothetical protein
MSPRTIFLLHDSGEIVKRIDSPYESEDLLQELAAQHPGLLAADRPGESGPYQWLLVTREAPVPVEEGGVSCWAVDHLLVDAEGVPTLVEVKRSSDTRIRREVVGQMLDYAAKAVFNRPLRTIRRYFEMNCANSGADPSEVLAGFLECETAEDA